MFMNTLLALYFSIVFMVALLAIVGPLTHACDIYHVLKVCKTRICLAAWKKLTSKRKTGKRRRIFPDAAPTSKSAQDIEQEAEHHQPSHDTRHHRAPSARHVESNPQQPLTKQSQSGSKTQELSA